MKVDDDVLCLRINAPEWFKRADFFAWLEGRTAEQIGHPAPRGPAGWHKVGSGEPDEYADCFMVAWCDAPELSDEPGLPPDIHDEIVKAITDKGYDYSACVVWISNLEQE